MIYKNIIRRTLLFLLFTFVSTNLLLAQEKPGIDSLIYYVRNLQDPAELLPFDPNSPDYKSPEAELTLIFTLQGISADSLKEVSLKIGTHEGSADLKSATVQNTKDGKRNAPEKITLSTDGEKVIITTNVPSIIYNKKVFLTLKAKDTSGRESNALTKIFN